MTKYILNSGGVKRYPDRKREFHQEMIKGLGSKPKILICSFAQAREDWETKFPGYQQVIREDAHRYHAAVRPSYTHGLRDAMCKGRRDLL
jgi:hypothetical protein